MGESGSDGGYCQAIQDSKKVSLEGGIYIQEISKSRKQGEERLEAEACLRNLYFWNSVRKSKEVDEVGDRARWQIMQGLSNLIDEKVKNIKNAE